MPVRHQDHGGVPMTISIVLCGLDELFNLGLGQVLSTAKLTVWPPPRGNCSFLDGWLHQPQVRFCWHSRLLSLYTARTIGILRAVCKTVLTAYSEINRIGGERAQETTASNFPAETAVLCVPKTSSVLIS